MPPAFSPAAYSPPVPASPPVPSTLLVQALRSWRLARDNGEAVQPSLSHALRHQAGAMLAPVLASLMALCEAALARPLKAGASAAMSEDEKLVLGLVNGSLKRRACMNCTVEAASALDCALCSTRLMVAQALSDCDPSPSF